MQTIDKGFYVEEIKQRNYKTVYLTQSKKSFDDIFNHGKTIRLSRDTVKKYIADYLKSITFDDNIVHVTYITDNGPVDTQKNVTIAKEVKREHLDILLVDPKKNKHMASGEYNNSIENRKLYGAVITIIYKIKIQKPAAKRKRMVFNL